MLNSMRSFFGDWVFLALTFALGYALGAAVHHSPQEIHHWHVIDPRQVQSMPWLAPKQESGHEC